MIRLFIVFCGLLLSLACSKDPKKDQAQEKPIHTNCQNIEADYAQALICRNTSLEIDTELQRQSNIAPLLSKNIQPQVLSVQKKDSRSDIFPPLAVAVRLIPVSQSRTALNRTIEISLANGLQNSIHPNQKNKIPDLKRFQNQVQTELGQADFPNTFHCPSNIEFKVGERMIAFPIFDLGTVCSFNEIFSASIAAQPLDLADVTSEFRNKGEIVASITIPVVTPIVSQSILLEFKNSKVIDLLIAELRSHLGKSLDYATSSRAINKVAQKIVREMDLPLTIRMRQEFENTLLKTFFVPFPCESSTEGWCTYLTPASGPDVTSLLLKKNYEVPGHLLKHVHSNQRDLTNHAPVNFQFTSDDTNLLKEPVEKENLLLATVRQGDVIEFEINDVQKTNRQILNSESVRTPNLVCLDPYKNCLEGKWKCAAEGTVKNKRVVHHGCERLRNIQTKALCYISNAPAPRQIAGPALFSPVMCANPDAFKTLKQGEVKDGFECVYARSTTVEDEIPLCDTLPSPAVPKLPARTGSILSISAPSGTYEWVQARPFPKGVTPYFDDSPKKGTPVEIYKLQFQWQCTKESQVMCDADKWQDQWSETTTFSQPLLTPAYAPISLTGDTFDLLRESVQVKIIKDHSVATCPLTDLMVATHPPNRFTISIQNTTRCRFFDDRESQDSRPFKLALVNALFQKESFQCGYRVDSWDGKRSYVCNLPTGQILSQHTTVKRDDGLERPGIWIDYFSRFKVFGTFRRTPTDIYRNGAVNENN